MNFNYVIKEAPKELLIFVFFSFITTLLFVYTFTLSNEEYEAFKSLLVPHMGWAGDFIYVTFLAGGVSLLFTRKEKVRKLILFMFALLLLFGIYNLYAEYGEENYGNPFLTYGTFRPVWEIVLPIIWMYLLSRKKVRDYCNVYI